MASEQEMMADLATADAAGDTQLAQHIAGQIKAARGASTVGIPEASLRGAAQGATLGFGDELEAGWKSLFGAKYKATRDQLRADEGNARKQHPVAYTAAEILGGAAPGMAATALTGGAASPLLAGRTAMGLAAGQGAASGAGFSNADSARGLASDSGLGAGLGLAGYGIGEALGAAGRRLAGFARSRSTAAAAKAAAKEAEGIASEVGSATGSVGGEVQKGNRLVENLRGMNAQLTPEEEAIARKLEERLIASNRQALPGQAARIDAKDAELAALKAGASDTLKKRTAEALSPGEMLRQLKTRALRYGPVALGSLAGHAIGGPLGGAVGALAGAGTRPAVRSMMRMAKNPAVQKALFDATASAAESTPGELLRQLLARGTPVAASQYLAGGTE